MGGFDAQRGAPRKTACVQSKYNRPAPSPGFGVASNGGPVTPEGCYHRFQPERANSICAGSKYQAGG